ncbi:hypothetical protein LTR86_006003 [Recurvomyces mirabilis]|nr:hypothetical protein LTR86_006003 [Recurvomyces mirabilis]
MTVFVIPIWRFEFWDALGNSEGIAFLQDVAAFIRLRPQRLEASLVDTTPSWIDRVWIVQEFLLANKLYICFGSVRMKYDWDTLCGMYHTTDLGFEYYMPHFKHVIDRLAPYALLKTQRSNGWSQHRKPDLLSIILATRQAEATHPVNKVWGIAALISSKEQSDITLNYTMPISDAYIQATLASIDCIGTLDILHPAGLGQSKIEGLPTWAADFTQIARKLEFATHEPWLETPKLPGLPGLPVHNTFEEKKLEASEAPLRVPRVLRVESVNVKDRLLRLKGIYLGRIASTCVLQKSPKEKESRGLRDFENAGEYRDAYADIAANLARMLEAAKYRSPGLAELKRVLVEGDDESPAHDVRRIETPVKLAVELTNRNYTLESEELLRLSERFYGLVALVAACFRHWTSVSRLVLQPSPARHPNDDLTASAPRSYGVPREVSHYLDVGGDRAYRSHRIEEGQLPKEARHGPLWMDPVTVKAHLNCAEQETEGKAIFFTTTSGFIGLGRGDVLEGDVVVVVPGG